MASMERKQELCSPFILRRNPLRKTVAEIVRESRQDLQVRSTRPPMTPRDGHRQLFGAKSVRTSCENRPPSAFSLHARNFEVPSSRPSSGTRLPPLDHRPRVPAVSSDEDPLKAPVPKPPSDPPQPGLPRTRTRLVRGGSLATMLPVVAQTDEKDKSNADREQKQPAAKGRDCAVHMEVSGVSQKLRPRRAASESRIMQPGVDTGVRTKESRPGQRTDSEGVGGVGGVGGGGGGGGGDGPANTEDDAESLLWNTISPLLQELECVAAGSSERSTDRLCDLCERLHRTLAQADMLGRRCKGRSGILRTLFRLIDLDADRLNLHIAKLCLALCVTGNNLLNICKLVFKIGRSESNDILFQNDSIIDSLLDVLLREDVSASGEALLYCVGTLKFLSGNGAILKLLLDKNCVSVAQKLTQGLCRVEGAHFTIAGHILVQLTATLRNLADLPESRPLFVSHSILSELCLVLRHHHEDQDICTNVSRIFSKLSCYSECCFALARTPSCYQLFLEVLSKHHQKQDLVVRLLFTLGNLTAKIDEARQQLFRCSGSVDALLQLYDRYQRRGAPSDPAGVQEVDDVLVKLVRVLANMCIHPDVGPALAANADCFQLLMETLELRSVQESEELLVNVAATINNLSFYREENSILGSSRLAIAKLMLKLLLSPSMDTMLEATRVYGNLSLSEDVRDFIMQNKVYQFVVTLLDSKSADMCFSACGVLTNLAVDPHNRVSLSEEGAAAKLADCLKDFGAGDWQLAGQLCQAVWNMICGGSEKLLETQERESLLEILAAYLDEDCALTWTENQDARDFQRACWEVEFLPIAEKLLKALQALEIS